MFYKHSKYVEGGGINDEAIFTCTGPTYVNVRALYRNL